LNKNNKSRDNERQTLESRKKKAVKRRRREKGHERKKNTERETSRYKRKHEGINE